VDAPLVVGPIEVDLRGHVVRRGGEVVALKPKEFDLLAFLARNPGQVFTREQLLQHVWGYDFFGGSRTVDVHMRWLREKLEERPSAPRHLLTVRGVGYKLVR
jgi:DNA-binding response OmpR family regulator